LDVYVTFDSTHEAMRLDRLLSQNQVAHELVPIPRSLGSACGVAVRLRPEDQARAASIAAAGDVRTKGFHQL
jgi:hypothetical protein